MIRMLNLNIINGENILHILYKTINIGVGVSTTTTFSYYENLFVDELVVLSLLFINWIYWVVFGFAGGYLLKTLIN